MEDDKYKDFIANASLSQISLLIAKLELVQDDPELERFIDSLRSITG